MTALQEEGIEPTTIVPSCLGLAHPDVRSGPTIVMDVGATSTEALALANDEPLAMVTIDEGGDTVNRALANSHYLDEVEAERVKREKAPVRKVKQPWNRDPSACTSLKPWAPKPSAQAWLAGMYSDSRRGRRVLPCLPSDWLKRSVNRWT